MRGNFRSCRFLHRLFNRLSHFLGRLFHRFWLRRCLRWFTRCCLDRRYWKKFGFLLNFLNRFSRFFNAFSFNRFGIDFRFLNLFFFTQAFWHRRDKTSQEPIFRRAHIPAAVGQNGDNDANKYDSPARNARFRNRNREHQFRVAQLGGAFSLVAAHDFFTVQTQIIGIGANKANGVSRPRQIIKTTGLYGFQIDEANMQGFGDKAQIIAKFEP